MDSSDAAWMWRNALSFVEGGTSSTSNVIPESDVTAKRYLYGLPSPAMPITLTTSLRGSEPQRAWRRFRYFLAQYRPVDNDIREDGYPEEAFWMPSK